MLNQQAKQESNDDEYKREVKRQERVLTIMEKICELSQDPGTAEDVKGKYYNVNVNNMLKLYVAIDKYNKTGKFHLTETSDDNETQQSE